MRLLILLSVFVTQIATADVTSLEIKGKVVAFDQKTVTIEIAGENYKFDRQKLGKQFKKMKSGESVTIAYEKPRS